MGIGISTLKRTFDEVSRRGNITRKELSAIIGVSEVSACRAVDALARAGLLSLSKGTANGRTADIISVSDERLCLLIDLCGRGVSFAVSAPRAIVSNVQSIPFLHMRDTDANISIALSDVVRYIKSNGISPDAVAVAIPNTPGAPDPESFTSALAACGLRADTVVSGSEAACRYFKENSTEGNSFAFLSIDPVIWGCSSAEPCRMLEWGRIKVGAHHGESFESVLSYDTDEAHLKIYLERALTSISAVLSPDRIFVSSSFLPSFVMDVISKLPNAEDVSGSTPVMRGLLRFAKDRLFEKFILN